MTRLLRRRVGCYLRLPEAFGASWALAELFTEHRPWFAFGVLLVCLNAWRPWAVRPAD